MVQSFSQFKISLLLIFNTSLMALCLNVEPSFAALAGNNKPCYDGAGILESLRDRLKDVQLDGDSSGSLSIQELKDLLIKNVNSVNMLCEKDVAHVKDCIQRTKRTSNLILMLAGLNTAIEILKQLEIIWRYLDLDGDGQVSWDEVNRFVQDVNQNPRDLTELDDAMGEAIRLLGILAQKYPDFFGDKLKGQCRPISGHNDFKRDD